MPKMWCQKGASFEISFILLRSCKKDSYQKTLRLKQMTERMLFFGCLIIYFREPYASLLFMYDHALFPDEQ